MPSIELKNKSPEFKETEQICEFRTCDNPLCPHDASYKAPKTRSLNEYYWFCLDHIKEYNRCWDFFQGMNNDEIFSFMEKSRYGDRPTWKSDFTFSEKDIKDEAWDNFRAHNYKKEEKSQQKRKIEGDFEEIEAMAILGLEPPINLEIIKKKYKILAKKHHPDRNGGCKEAEETLKNINISYSIIKKAYERYEKLKDK